MLADVLVLTGTRSTHSIAYACPVVLLSSGVGAELQRIADSERHSNELMHLVFANW